MAVDPRTPVIVGVGQFTERIDDPGYRGMSSVELAVAAAAAALDDTGAPAAAARAIDTVVGLRQFEISGRGMAPLGCSTNYPRSVAQRVGSSPARAFLEPIGGQGPQHAVTEFGAAIAAGAADVVMVIGSENGSTLRSFAKRPDKPDHSESVEGQLEDRGYGYQGLFNDYTVAHGLIGAPAQYGLLENARRGRLGVTVAGYRRAMAELFAPFSAVAAANPYAASPVRRTVDEIISVGDDNRMICDPYPRLLVARDQVNQGAAVVITSVETARRLGVPEHNWVYLRGHAEVVEDRGGDIDLRGPGGRDRHHARHRRPAADHDGDRPLELRLPAVAPGRPMAMVGDDDHLPVFGGERRPAADRLEHRADLGVDVGHLGQVGVAVEP